MLMGKPYAYWLELEQRAEQLNTSSTSVPKLFQEIAELRGKVSFYENRVREMNVFRVSVTEEVEK